MMSRMVLPRPPSYVAACALAWEAFHPQAKAQVTEVSNFGRVGEALKQPPLSQKNSPEPKPGAIQEEALYY